MEKGGCEAVPDVVVSSETPPPPMHHSQHHSQHETNAEHEEQDALDSTSQSLNDETRIKIFVNRVDEWTPSRLLARFVESDPKMFSVTGTLSRADMTVPSEVSIVSQTDNMRSWQLALEDSDWVIVDIAGSTAAVDEADQILETLTSCVPKRGQQIKLALLSTFMTWARSPSLIYEGEVLPFSDDEFRGRKAHPHYQAQLDCEIRAIERCWHFGNSDTHPFELKVTAKHDQLEIVVLTAGLLYGDGENVLNVFFKKSWESDSDGVPIIGDGTNRIPSIHIADFSKIIGQVLGEPITKPYMIACDNFSDSLSATQRDIIESVAEAFADKSGGSTHSVSVAESYLIDELEQLHIDMLTADISMTSSFSSDYIEWTAPDGIVSNISSTDDKSCVKQYVRCRDIEPIRIIILGPPSSGKSELSSTIAKKFGITRVHAQDVIAHARQEISRKINELAPLLEDDENVPDAEKSEHELKRKQFTELKQELEDMSAKDRLSDADMQQYFKMKLNSKACMNQGYVLDGYPKSGYKPKADIETDVEALFGMCQSLVPEKKGKGGADKNTNDVQAPQNIPLPDKVFILHASEHAIRERLIELPQSEVDRSNHNSIEEFSKRWQQFVDVPHSGSGSPTKGSHPSAEDSMNRLSTIAQYFKARSEEIVNNSTTIHVLGELDVLKSKQALSQQVLDLIDLPSRMCDDSRPVTPERHSERYSDNDGRPRKAEKSQDNNVTDECTLQAVVDPAQKYLDAHVIPKLAESLIELVRTQPTDPIKSLVELLRARATGPIITEIAKSNDVPSDQICQESDNDKSENNATVDAEAISSAE